MVVADVFAQAVGGVEGLLTLPTRIPLQCLVGDTSQRSEPEGHSGGIFSDDALKSCNTPPAQDTRALGVAMSTTLYGSPAYSHTYPPMALFHVGYVALSVGNPLLALLAGPACAPQSGSGFSPPMGF